MPPFFPARPRVRSARPAGRLPFSKPLFSSGPNLSFMLKHSLPFLFLPLLLWSCGAADTGVETPEGEPVPVRFNTYIAQDAASRAADTPLSNITDIASLRTVGFGVFGYYDDDKPYDFQNDTPNFMYNQSVTWSKEANAWTYSPLKYWPNETGSESDGRTDRLSFFAYAPYLNSDSRLNFSANNAKGDPTVTYKTPNDLSQCLDVLYATKPDGTTLTDLAKQNVGDSVTFSFHHTMSRLNFNVRAAFDEIAAGKNAKADSTRITVESITLETDGSDGTTEPLFFTQGTLNLRTGSWTPPAKASGSATATPRLVLSGDALNPDVRDQGEKCVYQMLDADKHIIPGVDNTWRNAGNGYLTLVPNASLTTTPELKVTIVYHTTSDDSRLVLSSGRSRVTSTVSKTLSGFRFERGKAYAINLLIGMTTVKFSVQVQNWRDPITFAPIVDDWQNTSIIINFDNI